MLQVADTDNRIKFMRFVGGRGISSNHGVRLCGKVSVQILVGVAVFQFRSLKTDVEKVFMSTL